MPHTIDSQTKADLPSFNSRVLERLFYVGFNFGFSTLYECINLTQKGLVDSCPLNALLAPPGHFIGVEIDQ